MAARSSGIAQLPARNTPAKERKEWRKRVHGGKADPVLPEPALQKVLARRPQLDQPRHLPGDYTDLERERVKKKRKRVFGEE